MNCFQSLQTNFTFVSFGSSQRRFNKKTLTMIFCYGVDNFLTVMYLFYGATTFSQYTEAAYLLCAAMGIGLCYMIVVLKMEDIFEFIESLSKFIDERSTYPALSGIYHDMNGKVEMISAIFHSFAVNVCPIGIILSKFVLNLIAFHIDQKCDEVELPLPMWFPFDTQNPIGYSVAMFLQYIMVYLNFSSASWFLSLSLGSYLFAIAMVEDIKANLKAIKIDPKNAQGAMQSLVQLANFIQVHSMAKQFVQKFSIFSRHMYAAIFTGSLLTTCGAMLMFEMEISHPEINILILFEAIIYTFLAFAISFLFCEGVQSITDTFDEIGDFFDQFEWYAFSMEFKKMLPTVLILVQQPVTINCFGSIACSRDTFKKIAKGGYSYYNVLRRFIK